MIFTVAVVILLGVYALLLFFYFIQWKKLAVYKPSAQPSVPVSVIIAARNEENTLPALVQDLEKQDHPSALFEVIIINDFSTDNTGALGHCLPTNFRMLMPDCLPEHSSKKKALATGIAQAKGELILVTDADCRVEEKWVSTMASYYQETGASFIAAPVKYVYRSSLLQVLQALDFMTLQGITAASVGANFGSMCNGANLAYTKSAFEQVNGFDGIDKVPTGDDMLLMHKIWRSNPSKVLYLKSKEVIVSTAPMQTWKGFFMQRRRWASKTLIYDDYRLIAVLVLVLLVNMLPFALLIAGFFQPVYLLYLLIFLLGKISIEWPFVSSVARFYDAQKLMRYFPLLQPLHVFYTVLVGIWSQVGTYEWKGRMAHPAPAAVGEKLSAAQPSLAKDVHLNDANQ